MTPDAPATDSVRFALRSREAGEGPTLVLLHGFPTDSRVFDAQFADAAAGRLKARLIVVDLPGFGETPFDDDGVGAPEILEVGVLAESLANLIVGLSAGPVAVGGVAIGAYICIELAERHPELVSALVLMGTKAAPDAKAMAPQRESVAKLALEKGSDAVADELADQPLGPNADAAMRARMHQLIAAAEPRAIAALVRGLAKRPDPTAALSGLKVPTLVIAGTADPFTSIAEARRLAALVPGAKLVELAGVGHVAPLESPEGVTKALAAFLGKLPK
jgi:3-oxoadipate enol-lactonase